MTHPLLDDIFAAPNLPQLLDELNSRWQAEQAQRHVFWDAVRADQKAEFINGEGIYHSPAMLQHLIISAKLVTMLHTFVEAHQLGYVAVEKAMIRLTRNDYEPDIVFWHTAVIAAVGLRASVLPIPDFVVEILSPSTARIDRGLKFEDYARHGIAEYWIIDPETRTIEQYLLDNNVYQLHSKESKGTLTAVSIRGFILERESIFPNPE